MPAKSLRYFQLPSTNASGVIIRLALIAPSTLLQGEASISLLCHVDVVNLVCRNMLVAGVNEHQRKISKERN